MLLFDIIWCKIRVRVAYLKGWAMSSFIQSLKTKIPKKSFDDRDLRIIFRDITPNALRLAIKRAVDAQHLIQLKKGFYVWSAKDMGQPLSKLIVAGKLCAPSYISFESALSYHGLIPEAVYTTTSAHTQRRTKSFTTPLGDFSYQYIPSRSFPLGVRYETNTENDHFMMATPIKALLDLVFVTRKHYLSLVHLEEDLRIERKDLYEKINDLKKDEIKELAHSYRKKTTEGLGKLLIKEFL